MITGFSSACLNGIRVSLDSDSTTRMASTSSDTLSRSMLFCRPPECTPCAVTSIGLPAAP